MKSKILGIFSLSLVILSAFFLSTGLSLAQEQFITRSVTISKLLGKVEVLRKDALTWEEAKVGIELSEGDKIRTSEESKAELTFEDGSFMRLKEKTILGIKTARQEPSTEAVQYNLDFRVGEIMMELQKLKPGSSFKVETPTAVAAVRGTTYYMRTGTKVVDGVEKSFVEIYVDSADTILFTNIISGESCLVTHCTGAIVYDDGTVEGPFDVPPDQQENYKSGFDLVYDDSGSKKGMRDVDEEGEDDSDDLDGDVDDTTTDQSNSQDNANQDQTGEQEIAGLARVKVITDTDGDGYIDSEDDFPNDPTEWLDTDSDGTGNNADSDDDNDDLTDSVEKDNATNPLVVDTDGDTFDDFEDAFPNDDRVNEPLPEGTNITKGYGSWAELREAVLTVGNLENDVGEMIDDIHARGYEAAKENIFDHQAGKVMTDYWGNRVRVEEYIFKRPTEGKVDTVQILALNLRTAGPNAGISSYDFRIIFDQDISNTNLRELPWNDYMNNPLAEEFQWCEVQPNVSEDDQLILYQNGQEQYYNPEEEPYNYPIPDEFSLEVKSPYGNSVQVTEKYSNLYSGEIQEEEQSLAVWYQYQRQSQGKIYINGDKKKPIDAQWTDDWGDGWNQENRFSFLDCYTDGSWLMGAFYLIDDSGELANVQEGEDELWDIQGLRDLVNPDHNLEMVFLSSEFGDTAYTLPLDIAFYMGQNPSEAERESYIQALYNDPSIQTIDVITIPEITYPYADRKEIEE